SQCVSVSLSGELPVARRGPGGRRDLYDDAVSGVVPGEETLRVSPGGAARLRAADDRRIVVELVIPHDEVQVGFVDGGKGGAERIGCRRPDTAATFLQPRHSATRIHELLAKLVRLDRATERTRLRRSIAAAGKRLRVELENKPPVNWLAVG